MNAWRTIKLVAVSTAVVSALTAHAAQQRQNADLQQFLQEFHQNTVQVMDQIPAKQSQSTSQQAIIFNAEQAQDNSFVAQKDQVRGEICKLENGQEVCATDISGRAGFESNDLAENLVDGGRRHIKSVFTMDRKGLQSATLSVRPWSDDYWAIAKGVLGQRYEDPDKNDTFDWKENETYVLENPISNYLQNDLIDFLSPSEKYDLLVGDSNFTMTKKMWDEGRPYYERSGEVETWMGICHGWAPAAYMMDRATTKVNVVAADGKTLIPFYPSDIKSLGSLLWANVRVYNRFVGGRCNSKDPNKDADNGRITDQECFDTNPGTWHKTVINQIGISDRSFVMDATFDYEVWNKPVYSYDVSYFNVETFEKSDEAKDVVIKMSEFSKDKFKKYRSRKAKQIVGVQMRVKYIAETHPSHRAYDDESHDYVTTVTYRYDLELDGRGSIIGGEWYSNKHPDFLWTPEPGARALTQLDNAIIKAERSGRDLSWKKGQPIPQIWRQYIPQFSKEGKPIGLIVEGLIERSRDAGNQ